MVRFFADGEALRGDTVVLTGENGQHARVLRLRIHYNCVGTIEIPTVLPLPIPEVSVNTRKGVVVNYAPGQLAV